MKNIPKTKKQLIQEISHIKTRLAQLEDQLVDTKQSFNAIINSIEDIIHDITGSTRRKLFPLINPYPRAIDTW